MIKIVDTFFFFVFSFTSLFWWVPFLTFIFAPFFISRKLKRNLSKLAEVIGQTSEIKLKEFIFFQQKIASPTVSIAKRAEKKTKKIYNRLTDRLYKKAVWWIRFEILENIPKGAKVLDIGAGNGYLAELITKTKDCEVVCVDVADFNQAGFETVLFDGVDLPFEDNEFDIVVLSYVLHHSDFQKELLKEARRVCKGKIIIYEDEVSLALARDLLAKVHQKAYNWLYDLESPVNYKSLDQWRNLFDDLELEVNKEKTEWVAGSLLAPIKRTVFVLKKVKN